MKSEFIEVLAPLFGEGIKKVLEKYYEEGEIDEMTAVAEHMLTGYLGKEAGEALVKKILAKHPVKSKKTH